MNAFDVGQIVGGKYRVQRVIGRGGMGLVVEADHLVLSARVAIKFLAPELAQNPEAAGRFLREARTTFGMRSPHIVAVLDVGHTEAGLPFIVMEYLEGEDLGVRLQRLGTLPESQAVEILQQAAQGVAYAHSQGIIHRDLKPSNLLCTNGKGEVLVVKVVDFGISKLTAASALGKDSLITTHTGTILGSPLYMAPEQLQSAKHLDEGCDIWALGVILFELLAGRPPFLGSSITEVAINVATQPTPDLVEFRSDVSPAVQAVVSRCLKKSRAERYPTAEALLAALRDCAAVALVPAVAAAAGDLASTRRQGAEAAVAHPPSRAQEMPTLTLDTARGPGSSTNSPVSSTHAPGGFTTWARTKVAATAMGLALVFIAGWLLLGPQAARDVTPSSAAGVEPRGVLGDRDGSQAVATQGLAAPTSLDRTLESSVVITAPIPSPEPQQAKARPPAPERSGATAALVTQSPSTQNPSSAGPATSRAVPPRIAPELRAAAGAPTASAQTHSVGRAARKEPQPCAPYHIRNGVRVFNDACILQREAEKGRSAPASAKKRNP